MKTTITLTEKPASPWAVEINLKKYPPEEDEGKTEYKLKIIRADYDKINRLASQLKYRLAEGGGEAFYVLGVTDEGLPEGLSEEELGETLEALHKACNLINAKVIKVREREGRRGRVVELLIRASREDEPPLTVTVTALGNVDAGKSTLIGVLSTGKLDDGRGSAMKRIARYLHEIESGRTSSICSRLLGFDVDGNVVNYVLTSPLNEAEIYLRSFKVIDFVDLGGHERYLKTTLRGVMSREPDYVMLVVGANAGLLRMGKEHLGISVALGIPIFAVFTKVDLAPIHVLKRNLNEFIKLLKMPGIDKLPLLVRGEDDAILAARHIQSGRVVPIFMVSNVNGKGLNLLTKFLNLLPPRREWKEWLKRPFKLYVEDLFNVKGVGPVVAGLVVSGSISEGATAFIGPFKDGSWKEVKIKSIHLNRIPIHRVSPGQYVTLALSGIEFEEIEKGQVLLDRMEEAKTVKSFEALITILKHPTTIRRGYQAVFHSHSIRSTVTFESMEKEPLRTGDTSKVRLSFVYHPWHVEEGATFILREARTKAIGVITKLQE